MFTRNNNIRLKCEIGREINILSRCVDRRFKNFATID